MNNDHDLRAVDRRALNPNGAGPALYVAAIIVLSVLGVGGIIALQLGQPEKDHTSTITLILGFLVPVVTALLAGAVAQVQKSVNGRLTQLLAMTARTHAAEGELAGREKMTQQLQVVPAVVVPPSGAPVVVAQVPPSSPPTADGTFQHSRSTDNPHQHSRSGDERPEL